MDLRRLAARALGHVGLAAAIASAITTPVHAASSTVTEVTSGVCPPDRREFEWAASILDAYDAQPSDGDLRVSVAMLLEPQFDGARAFHEPSGFRTMTTSSWDYTSYVADDVVTTTVIGKRDAGPHVLAGHALYGMGKQVVVLTVGSAVGEVKDWWNNPLHYYASRTPGISSTYQVMTAPSQAAAFKKFAETIPAQWQSFLAAKDTEQAQIIGAAAATVGVALAPFAKGTGSAALDGWLARWSKAQEDLLNLGKKKPPPPKGTSVAKHEPIPTPKPIASSVAVATPVAIATPVMTAERAKEWFSETPPPSRHSKPIPVDEIAQLREKWGLPKKKVLLPTDLSEARAIRFDELDGKKVIARSEAEARKLLGMRKDSKICDHVYQDADGGLVPVETKDVSTIDFHTDKNSAANKFEAIAAADTKNQVKRFEVVVSESKTKLAEDKYFVDPTNGQIWRHIGGTQEFVPWFVGPRNIPVFVRSHPL